MSGHWLRRAAYRCRHGYTSAHLPITERTLAVYWQEARLAQDLITANSALAHLGGVEDLASYLRARDAVIVCGFGTLTIEAAAVVPVQELFAEPTGPEPTELESVEVAVPVEQVTDSAALVDDVGSDELEIPAGAPETSAPSGERSEGIEMPAVPAQRAPYRRPSVRQPLTGKGIKRQKPHAGLT